MPATLAHSVPAYFLTCSGWRLGRVPDRTQIRAIDDQDARSDGSLWATYQAWIGDAWNHCATDISEGRLPLVDIEHA